MGGRDRSEWVVAIVGMLIFIGGDKQNAAELARLKGEMDAIRDLNSCGLKTKMRKAMPAEKTRRAGRAVRLRGLKLP